MRATAVALLTAGALGSVPPALDAQDRGANRVEELVREATRRYNEAGSERQAPAVAQQPSPQPVLPLMLEDAVKRALEKNLDIAVQRMNPQIVDMSVTSLLANYRPTITSSFGNESQTQPPITLLTGAQRVETTTTTVNGALADNLPKGGGNVSLNWSNNRVSTNSLFYNFNPAYNSTLKVEYTQPLFRGLRTDATREQLVVTKLNREISDLQLQTTIVNTLTSVRQAYWDLVFAVQSIEVARQALDLASQLVRENQSRVEFGTMTRLDLATARAQEASSQHALVQAEGNRRIAELALKRLMVESEQDPLWQSELDPVDRPTLNIESIDVAAAVRRALNQRTELHQARRQLAANQAAFALLEDQTRPQADLVASYSMVGLGGTQLIRPPDFFTNFLTNPILGKVPGNYGDALGEVFRRRYPTWNVAVNISYPFGFSPAKAAAARARIQMNQVDAQLRQLEVAAVTEVTNAAIQLRNDADDIMSSRVAKDAAQEKLQAEQRKYQAGISTNFVVVQAQRDLADAQNAELRAEVAYRKALVDFERLQQTTLQAAGVTVVSTNGLMPTPVGSRRP